MKDKHIIIILCVLIAVFLALIAAGIALTEANKKPILSEKMMQEDYGFLYNFYIARKPSLEGRPYYGQENASLTFIIYTDFTSPGAQDFKNTTLPWLIDSYVHTGKARLYHKHYLTAADLLEQNEAYYYAQSYQCYANLYPAGAYDFYFALYDTRLQDVPELVESLGGDRRAFMDCLKQQPFKEIKEDIAEAEQFGMIGITPWLSVGIQGRELSSFAGTPAQDRLYRTIRGYQTLLGD